MSAISQKSITGITSITTPAGIDNIFTVHTNDTTERFRVDSTGNLNIAGIVTVTKDLDVDGHTNLDNVSIAGVTTTTGFIESVGTSGRGAKLGGLSVGYDSLYATIQPITGNFLHLNYNAGTEVRIGASNTKVDLDVNGDVYPKASGNRNLGLSTKTWNNVYATTFICKGDFVELDVDGHTELDNVNISGVSTYAGQARFNGELVGSIISVQNSINIADKLIHSGDPDTCIRFPDVDTFTVETSNTERFRIGSNGYIGVGDFSSKSRTDPLNVDSGIGTCNIGGNYIHLKRYSGGGTNYITAPENNANLYISADDHIVFGVDHSSSMYTHGTEALRIVSNGNIGAGGITTPLWTSGGGIHLNDNYGIGFGNGGSGRPDFQLMVTDGSTLQFRCGFGADTADINMDTSGRLLVNTTSATISSNELFEVKSTAGGFSHFRNNSSSYAPIYIDNEATNDGDTLVPLITITDGGGNRAGLLMNNTSVFDISGQGAVTFSTGGTVGNAVERFRIKNDGRVGINNTDPSGRAGGSLDISITDNTTGHGVLTDQRGRSDLILRNKSGTLYSYTQLMFTNGNDGFNSACFLRHTKGGYLQNENFIGDLILMQRVAGNGSANPDFREKTVWPGGTTKAKQIWWANGTGQQANGTHNGWHHFAEQNPQGNNEYQYFTLDLGAASYSRAGLARYTILWNTGHASGTGHQTGEFRWFNHHSGSTCNILEHIILRRGYNNGSYYGWNDAPLMKLHHSSNSGNNACIHLKCQGRRSSGYDMGLYVTIFLDLYAPKASNGNVTPTLRARGYSAPSDMSSSEFTNQGRNASYVSYQSSAPPLTQNP